MAGKRKATTEPPRPPLPGRFSRILRAVRSTLGILGTRFLTHLLLPILIPVLCVLLVLLLLNGLQSGLREPSRPLPVSFRDTDCPTPPGMSRADFLDNVQAYANLPDDLDLLDPDTVDRITTAFSSNPWVERVIRVTPLSKNLRVELAFRQPVLAVPIHGRLRAVDARGILLPERAVRDDLPQFSGEVRVQPAGPGRVWADPRLTAGARVTAYLHPQQDRLRLEKIDADERGILLRTAWGWTIVWGSPPGSELQGELPAEEKVARLLRAIPESGPLELDLRR